MLLLLPIFLLSGGKAHARSSAVAVVACTLTVPANPFSAAGLATPWVSSCNQADPAQSVFVQAAIFDKLSHQLAIYPPLVISAGTQPALPTVLPTLPLQYEAALFGGGNDDMTTLVGPGAAQCVNGIPGQVFGQVFFCGARQFFTDVNNAHIPIPPPARSLFTNEPCPTVRDFRIVDQDQSDNVQTTYLVTANGQTAQDTAANRTILGATAVAKNPSDNRLLTNFVDPVIGCMPWLLPDLSDYGALVPSQAADELQAARYQGNATGDQRGNHQDRPIALIPAGDPMAGPNNVQLLNLYRVNVDQPPVFTLAQANTMAYCQHIKNVQLDFINRHQAMFLPSPSPTPGVNLDDFLLGRLAATNMILGCPVTLNKHTKKERTHTMHFQQHDRIILLGNPPITTNSIPDDLFVSEGPAGRWMSIPLSHEEVQTMQSLPKKGKDEFKKNVHEYIGQLGKEYPKLTAMPLDEAPYAG